MGSGIAQVAAQQGIDVVLWDLRDDLLAAALERIRASLERNVQRSRISRLDADAALERITTTTDFADFGRVDVAIEAVLEDLTTKAAVFRSLDASAPADAILATNTSSLSVTAIAAATQRPDRVVGMHFFNPVPAMTLVEVVRGTVTSSATTDRAVALAHELGKTPVRAEDTPGFIVNRIVRPFYNEAVRLMNDGVASAAEIDRIMKGVGFRMGPFELMDLIGNDVNFAVSASIYHQLHDEPRFRPSFRQERLVQGGNLGQKTGRGWYDYREKAPPGQSAGLEGRSPTSDFDFGPILVVTDSAMGAELARALAAAGCDARVSNVGEREIDIGAARLQRDAAVTGVRLVVDAVTFRSSGVRGASKIEGSLDEEAVIAALTLSEATTILAARYEDPSRVCGFGYLPPLADAGVLEVANGLRTSDKATAATVAMVRALGKDVALVADGAGLVAPRIVSLIVNEAAYALTEGVASAEDIDLAVRLGANYPHGPLEWADLIGVDEVCAIITAMEDEFGEDRYRPAPLLRKMVSAGWTGRAAGRGFFDYRREGP
jgi:3-hydroxybutyryl-CoA dehydrogenase